jgi:hypothetical protein
MKVLIVDAREHADLVLTKPVRLEKIKKLVALTQDLIAKRAHIRKLSDEAIG